MKHTARVRRTRTETAPAAPPVASGPGTRMVATALTVFAVVFTTLAVASYTRTSATWDEPIHLTAGYAGLARGDFRIDPSHPPFVRMWAALPLLAMSHVTFDTTAVDAAAPAEWMTGPDAYTLAHRFLYRQNDADRLLYAGRFMTVLLGLLLGVLLFFWTLEWLGFRAALLALLFYSISPNIAAHSSLVTTDLGVACFFFGAVYFLWRTCREATPANVAGLSAFFALAMISKFSGVILAPLVVALLALAVLSWRTIMPKTALAVLGSVLATSVLAIWAVYGFRYAPSANPAWLFTSAGAALPGMPGLAPLLGWVDAHHLLPNAFTRGFLFSLSSATKLPAFLAGDISLNGGWWYYFPVAFLLKTPSALTVLLLGGLVLFARRRHRLGAINEAFVVLPIVAVLGVAIASGINIGVRHILPVYPFVILIAATAADAMIGIPHVAGRVAVTTMTLYSMVTFASVYPHTLTFFSRFAGGPANGLKYLADSNLGWGQSLKALKGWMDDNGVEHINLAYFGQADPAYYGINCTHLPGAPTFAVDQIRKPTLPGYVAISGTILTGVYLPPPWRLFYRGFQDEEPVAVIGNSIRVYWVEQWPEADLPADEVRSAENLNAQAFLADALFIGQQWPRQALVHYREYLKARPNDPRVLERSGLALASIGENAEALEVFRRTVALDPRNPDARRRFATMLLAEGDLDGATEQVGYAMELQPGDAGTHDLLGRILAAKGYHAAADAQFQEALRLEPANASARQHLAMLREQVRRQAGVRR